MFGQEENRTQLVGRDEGCYRFQAPLRNQIWDVLGSRVNKATAPVCNTSLIPSSESKFRTKMDPVRQFTVPLLDIVNFTQRTISGSNPIGLFVETVPLPSYELCINSQCHHRSGRVRPARVQGM